MAGEGARVVVCDIGASLEGAGTDPSPAQQAVDEIKRSGGEALGMGDAKLMAAICSLSGIGAFPFVSFVGACSFLMAYGIRSVQSSRAQEQEQAFGPHLAIGASLYFCADFFLWPGHVNGMVLGLFYL